MNHLNLSCFEEKIKSNISKITDDNQEKLRRLLDENNQLKIELIGNWLDIGSDVHLLYLIMGPDQHCWFNFPNLSELTGVMFIGDENLADEYRKLACSKNIKLNLIYPRDNSKDIDYPNVIVDEKLSEDVLTDRNLFPNPDFQGKEIYLGRYEFIRKSGELKKYKQAVVEVIKSIEAPHTVDLYIKEKGTSINKKIEIEAKECSLYSHPLAPVRKTPKEITFLGTFSLSVDDDASFIYLTEEYLRFRLKRFHLPEKTLQEVIEYMKSLDVYCNYWEKYVHLLADRGFVISNSPKSKRLTKLGLVEIELPQSIQELLALDESLIYKLRIRERLNGSKYITKLFIYRK